MAIREKPVQEEFAYSITKYRDETRDTSSDPYIMHAWRPAIECIIRGATPTDEEFGLLTRHAKRYHHLRGTGEMTDAIWTCFDQMHYLRKAYVATKYSCALAEIAVKANPSAKNIMNVLCHSGSYRIYYGDQFHVQFKKAFPIQGAMLLERVRAQRLHVDTHFLDAYREDMTIEDMRGILPLTPSALAWLVTSIGQSNLGDEYYNMAIGLKDRWPTYRGNRYNHPVKMLLETLPEPYRAFTIKEAPNIFNTSTRHYAHAIAQTKNAPEQSFKQSLAHLANLQQQHPAVLRKGYDIPQDMCGAQLCKMVIFLEKTIVNPSGMITGLPEEEAFTARAFESQLRGEGGIKLFRQAKAARQRLQEKLQGDPTHKETLLARLKNLATEDSGKWLFHRLVAMPSLDSASGMHLLTCYMDVLRCSKKLSPEIFDELCIGHPKMEWLDEPSEKEALAMIQTLDNAGID